MLSAIELARDLEQGRTTPDQIRERIHDALTVQEPVLHAFAFANPKPSTDRSTDGTSGGPLFGLPFAAKDNLDTDDCPTSFGSPIYANHRPGRDAACVALARDAGAVLIGKSAMAEFALMRAPATRNPHNPDHTPGGSSSGSAAAVAAGMVAFAFGSQTAGSVIRPAAFCGVAGYKPTFGLVPTDGLKFVSPSLDTIGLFATSVADVAFVINRIAPGVAPQTPLTKPLRVGVCMGWADIAPASDDMSAAVDKAVQAFGQAGASSRPVILPERLADADAAHATILAYEAARALWHERNAHEAELSDDLTAFLDAGRAIEDDAYRRARESVAVAKTRLHDLFGEIDVLATPSADGLVLAAGAVLEDAFKRGSGPA